MALGLGCLQSYLCLQAHHFYILWRAGNRVKAAFPWVIKNSVVFQSEFGVVAIDEIIQAEVKSLYVVIVSFVIG